MIIIDWGNCEETVIIVRIEGDCSEQDCKIASYQLQMMLFSSTKDLNIILDVRMAQTLSRIMGTLSHQLRDHMPKLNRIIVLATEELERELPIIANFYPEIVRVSNVVETVEAAYQLVEVA